MNFFVTILFFLLNVYNFTSQNVNKYRLFNYLINSIIDLQYLNQHKNKKSNDGRRNNITAINPCLFSLFEKRKKWKPQPYEMLYKDYFPK